MSTCTLSRGVVVLCLEHKIPLFCMLHLWVKNVTSCDPNHLFVLNLQNKHIVWKKLVQCCAFPQSNKLEYKLGFIDLMWHPNFRSHQTMGFHYVSQNRQHFKPVESTFKQRKKTILFRKKHLPIILSTKKKVWKVFTAHFTVIISNCPWWKSFAEAILFLQWCIIQQFLNKIHMRKQHPPATVPLQA